MFGDDPDEAIAARERKQAFFEALDANVPVVQAMMAPVRRKSLTLSISGSPSFSFFRGSGQGKDTVKNPFARSTRVKSGASTQSPRGTGKTGMSGETRGLCGALQKSPALPR
jgi:hypothetical protein